MVESKFDISTHSLVPKHRKLLEKEEKELLSKYNISKIQLPEIKSTDSAIITTNPQIGDIIEIKRQGLTQNEIYFRRVVK